MRISLVLRRDGRGKLGRAREVLCSEDEDDGQQVASVERERPRRTHRADWWSAPGVLRRGDDGRDRDCEDLSGTQQHSPSAAI